MSQATSTKFKINKTGFDSDVDAVKLAGETIDAAPFNNKNDIEAGVCKEIAIIDYVDRLLTISDLLKDYRQLVTKDMAEFKRLGDVNNTMETKTAAAIKT